MQFMHHRSRQPVRRLIRKWLKAGVSEDGKWWESDRYTARSGDIATTWRMCTCTMCSTYGSRYHGGKRRGKR